MNKSLTELIVILDASGSMAALKNDVIGGFNQLIEDQQKEEGDCFVTVVQFSSFGRQKTLLDCEPIQEVEPFTDASYKIGGWTALYDTLGDVIDVVGTRLANTPESKRPGKVIVSVITDGQENHSREYTSAQVCEKVTQQQDVYSWEFIFTGANQNAIFEANKLGIKSGMTATYKSTRRGTKRMFGGISSATSALRSCNAVAAGAAMKSIEDE
jgi:uncharacterized protein YegL